MMSSSMSKAVLGWAVLSTILSVGLAWHDASMRAERQQLQQEKADLNNRVVRLTAQVRSTPAAAPVTRPANASEPAPAKPDPALLRSLDEKDQSISMLRQEAASARDKISELENTLLTLQSKSALQDQKREQLLSAQASCDQRVADLQHSIELAQVSLQEGKAKLSSLEAANATLKSQVAAAAHSPQTSELLAQLRDIDRRRATQMREIVNRYRDIGSQYRSLAGALAGRQNQQTGPWNSAELSRIQSAISSEEEGLRQMDELNDQAALLEKKLARH
jgi:chromosome segregation ATPase